MLRNFLIVFPLLLILRDTMGQVCLQVVDATTHAPIGFCQIYDGTGAPLTTSVIDGHFCLAEPAPLALVVHAPGYHAQRVELADLLGATISMDPLRVDLAEVRIRPDPHRSLGTAMLTATLLDTNLLWNFERAGLHSAMQWVPGVQMDQRGHGGSMRLSIRGSVLRSPFGVRGVKVYWGGLPITLADGSTPLELMDPEVVGSMQVVRSIGPPAYGSAPSGLLLIRPPLPFREGFGFNGSITGGSYGFRRVAAHGSWKQGGHSMVVGVVNQRNSGYREQEATARDQIFLVHRKEFKRTSLQSMLILQQVSWQLPGGLDSAMAAIAPRQANAFSKLINARLEKRQVLIGVAVEHGFSRSLELLMTFHGQIIDKLNPFGTSPVFSGYKQEEISAASSRIALAWERPMNRWSLGITTGTEILTQRDQLDEQVFVNAVPDSLRTRADTRVLTMNFFTEARLIGPRGTEVFAAVGMEWNGHDHRDRLANTSVISERASGLQPVVGISQSLGKRWGVSLRHGASVSRPTVWELLGSRGNFDVDLGPEQVNETELAIAHGDPGARFHFQAAGYLRRTRGLILPVPSVLGTGNDFRNAGAATQRGLEAFIQWRPGTLPTRGASFISTVTLQDHVVVRATTEAHRVPGVPSITAGGIVRYQGPAGVSVEVGGRHVGEIPVGPTATFRLPSYQVFHLRGEWSVRSGTKATWSAFIHVENLTDTGYSTFVQASDPLGRYHNPAPDRSFFVGLRFQHHSSGTRTLEH